jgi:hypothetical protein
VSQATCGQASFAGSHVTVPSGFFVSSEGVTLGRYRSKRQLALRGGFDPASILSEIGELTLARLQRQCFPPACDEPPVRRDERGPAKRVAGLESAEDCHEVAATKRK